MKSIRGGMSAVVLALMVMNAYIPAQTAWSAGPDWVLLDENKDSRFYYDKNGASSPAAGIVRATARVVYTEKGKAEALEILTPAKNYERLFESRYRYDLDCARMRSRLLDVTHLDENDATIKTTDLAAFTPWEDIPPEARIEVIAQLLCPP